MTNLKNIKFYELARKRPQGEKKTKWVRNGGKFEAKVIEIKRKAEIINKKLVNYP